MGMIKFLRVLWILNVFSFLNAAQAEFRFRINEDLGTLDWGYGEVAPNVVQQLMEGLTISGKNGEPLPALARSWRLNPENVYSFELREDAVWSDGQPICAS